MPFVKQPHVCYLPDYIPHGIAVADIIWQCNHCKVEWRITSSVHRGKNAYILWRPLIPFGVPMGSVKVDMPKE